MLPAIRNETDDRARADRLDAYVETYLKEEIQQEALVRNLDSFFRFLRVAALCSGQILDRGPLGGSVARAGRGAPLRAMRLNASYSFTLPVCRLSKPSPN